MRGLLLAALLGLALLAGCVQDAPSPKEGTGAVGVITDPKDVANRTGEHVHDYWGGKDSVDLVDATSSSTWNNLGGGRWRRTFVPPDEVVVPQGTASINVTVGWVDDLAANSYGPVSLWVKPANTVEPRFVQVVASGDKVEVPVAYEEADLPHQLLSAWEFIVQYNSSTSYNAFFGETSVVATAHRGHPLRPFPAHPDLWQGRSEFVLADAAMPFQNVGYTGTGSIPTAIRALDGALVPPDAARVDVAFTVDGGAAPEAVGWLQVQYHAADSRAWQLLGVVSSTDGSATWSIPLAPGMGDGPYGNASLWQFRVSTPSTAPSSTPSVFAGSFHLVATVHKA